MSAEAMYFNKSEMNCILENKYLEWDYKHKIKDHGIQIISKSNLQ